MYQSDTFCMKDKILTITIVFLILLSAGFVVWFIFAPKSSGHETIDEATAVQIIKSQFPEMKGYPRDQLPPTSIRTEKSEDGWYVAFVQEGSGVPIIEARCFLVKNDKSILQRKYIPQDSERVGEFSVKECRVIENAVGGDKDEHGCIGSAGYSWCQEQQKCLRPWEEPCVGNSGSSRCARENCHGLDIKCGSNPPKICTELYEAGDKCLQYAQCGVRNGICGLVENTSFTRCKTCVQHCINENKDNSQKLFGCESTC